MCGFNPHSAICAYHGMQESVTHPFVIEQLQTLLKALGVDRIDALRKFAPNARRSRIAADGLVVQGLWCDRES